MQGDDEDEGNDSVPVDTTTLAIQSRTDAAAAADDEDDQRQTGNKHHSDNDATCHTVRCSTRTTVNHTRALHFS